MLRNRTQLVLCPLTRAIAWLERSTQHQSLVPMFPKCETWGTFPVERRPRPGHPPFQQWFAP